VGADIKEVRAGIGSDRRIGYHFIYPGVGYGGSCFPKDVNALIRTAEEIGYSPELICAVDLVNTRQKIVLAQKIMDYFHSRGGVKGKILALWGLAFKANTEDVREIASLEIIKCLTKEGMEIRAFDPEAWKNAAKLLSKNSLIKILDNQYEALEGADALAVVTDWNQFRNPDFARIKRELKTPVLFDGRNLFSASFLASQGFTYHCIGRPQVSIV
jgi:UDPglucose 6-dehydrogenase